MPNPMKKSLSKQEQMAALGVERPEVVDEDLEMAPLLEDELGKIHNRTRWQTGLIAAQTILLLFLGVILVVGVIIINYRFNVLNEDLGSIAETGEMARPLLNDLPNLGSGFNNLTSSLGDVLGLSGNNSVASGVRDFGENIAQAGQNLLGQLSDGIQSLIGGNSTAPSGGASSDSGASNQTLFDPNGGGG